jgi:hypothetical protein
VSTDSSAAPERCNHPLGSSEATYISCARHKGHPGEHSSAFRTNTWEARQDAIRKASEMVRSGNPWLQR